MGRPDRQVDRQQRHKLDEERLDWPAIIEDLRRAGFPPKALSLVTGIPKTTIQGWMLYDGEPKHVDGERLVTVWRQWFDGVLPRRKLFPPVTGTRPEPTMKLRPTSGASTATRK